MSVRSRLLCAGLALLFSLATRQFATASAELDRRLDELAIEGHFAGAVVIRRDDRVVYQRGLGLADPVTGRLFSPNTVVETGSVTKPVTAAAVLTLAADGRLNLDEAVRASLPEYPHPGTTVGQLLMHAGALPDYSAFEPELTSGRVIRATDLLAMIGARSPQSDSPAGRRFSYCNICFDTLALLVERKTGQSFEAFVRGRFLEPAGATGVFVRPARLKDWRGERSAGYRRTPAGVEPNDVFDNEGFYGGGNLYFSAADLAAWMAAWANRHAALRPIRDLSTRPVAFPDGRSGLTLGSWYCAPGQARCYYPGHHQGFHAFGYWDSRRRLAIALVSNGTLSPRLQVEIPRLLIAAAEGRTLPARSGAAGGAAQGVQPGVYLVQGVGTVTISAKDGRLGVIAPGFTRYPLFPAGDGWLYAPGLDLYLTPGSRRGEILWWSVFHQSVGRQAED